MMMMVMLSMIRNRHYHNRIIRFIVVSNWMNHHIVHDRQSIKTVEIVSFMKMSALAFFLVWIDRRQIQRNVETVR